MTAKKQIKFGTDGWRGVISDDFTFDNVKAVSQAISDWINFNESKKVKLQKRVAVGFDTRFLSREYAQAVSCVLAANGLTVLLSDKCIPTPMLSFAVKQKKLIAGVMITASHNPYRFNGIKIKTFTGAAASEEVTGIVEKYLHKRSVKILDIDKAVKSSLIKVEDFAPPYISFLKSYVNLNKISQTRFRVLVDVMHGSGNGFLSKILRSTILPVVEMRSEINPYFSGGRPEPIPENLSEMTSRMKKERFDIGLVLDGDADRIAAMDSEGNFISPQKLLGLYIIHLIKNKKMSGGVVKTIVGTTLISNIANSLNLKLYETPVGFKYISDLMVNEDILVGGEEAGGMGFRDFIPERDGSLAGLLLLEMMAYQKSSIKEIINDMEANFGRYFYVKDSITLSDNKTKQTILKKIESLKASPILLGEKIVQVKDYDGVKLVCSDESWLMLRASGTEPLVRIYSEAKNLKRANALIKFGSKFIS